VNTNFTKPRGYNQTNPLRDIREKVTITRGGKMNSRWRPPSLSGRDLRCLQKEGTNKKTHPSTVFQLSTPIKWQKGLFKRGQNRVGINAQRAAPFMEQSARRASKIIGSLRTGNTGAKARG